MLFGDLFYGAEREQCSISNGHEKQTQLYIDCLVQTDILQIFRDDYLAFLS